MLYYRNALCYARGDHRGWEGPEYEAAARAWTKDAEREFKAQYGG